MTIADKREEGCRILKLSKEERKLKGLPVSNLDIANHLEVAYLTVCDWEKRLPTHLKSVERYRAREIVKIDKEIKKERIRKREEGYIPTDAEDQLDSEDPLDWLRNRTQKANESLLKSVQAGSPASIRTFYQILGLLQEKMEVKLGLSGDEIARRHLEARKELAEDGYTSGKTEQPPSG